MQKKIIENETPFVAIEAIAIEAYYQDRNVLIQHAQNLADILCSKVGVTSSFREDSHAAQEGNLLNRVMERLQATKGYAKPALEEIKGSDINIVILPILTQWKIQRIKFEAHTTMTFDPSEEDENVTKISHMPATITSVDNDVLFHNVRLKFKNDALIDDVIRESYRISRIFDLPVSFDFIDAAGNKYSSTAHTTGDDWDEWVEAHIAAIHKNNPRNRPKPRQKRTVQAPLF